MIIYNMRYRGPYEYDKLILNVLQYHNEVLGMKKKLESEDSRLENISEQIDLMRAQMESISNQILDFKEEGLER